MITFVFSVKITINTDPINKISIETDNKDQC